MAREGGRRSASDRWSRAVPLMLSWILFVQGVPPSKLEANDDCHLFLVDTQITDNGDGDGFADTNEALQIGISVQGNCPPDSRLLNDCMAWLSTESAAIECMRRPEILIGDLPENGPAVTPAETFEIKIGNVDRTDLGLTPDDLLEAHLDLDIRCAHDSDAFHWFHESIRLPLDLNVSGLDQTPVGWMEGFEDGGTDPLDPLQGTAFHAQNLDAGIPGASTEESLANADGWRCQYNDPDWANSSTYNRPDYADYCYPGLDLSHAYAIYWQLDGSQVADSPDGGRAFRGEKSLYYGVFLGEPDESFTTPISMVESVATVTPINLGTSNPQLSFWHQVSLADQRIMSPLEGSSVDRGVVQIRLYDSANEPIGHWMNLQAIQNAYTQRGATHYYNCMFDPIDDGNNEDDFYDPTDPDRENGPSSTCWPTPSWAFMGSTTGLFSVYSIGYGTKPPDESDVPSMGVGTWVESKIDLTEFRGRRAKLRFLVTSIEIHQADTWTDYWGTDLDERDDGWWIDEIAIDETLTEPAVFANDVFLLGSCSEGEEPCIGQCRTSLAPCSDTLPCSEGEGDCVAPCPPGGVCSGPPPDCGSNCALAEVNAFIEPDGPPNPAQVTTNEPGVQVAVNLQAWPDPETGAEPSWVDVCIDGYREYRACISGDPDGDLPGLPDADCDDAWDSFDCESCSPVWSTDSTFSPGPDVVTTYAMEVRCSTAPDCRNGRTLEIVVHCPNGDPNTLGLREMRALNRETLTWRGPLDVDWLRGRFSTGAEIGNYLADFTDVAFAATSIPMDDDPPVGTGYYYLVKKDGPTPTPAGLFNCSTATWRSGGDAETHEPARNIAFGNP